MPKIAIIVPCINLWNKYTKACIDSIKTKYLYRILLIDNGSTDDTKIEAGKLVSNTFSHLRNEEAWSCAKSWNYGVKDAFERGYDYVLILNNDILLHPDAIDLMVERFKESDIRDNSLMNPEFLAMVSCLDVRSECHVPEELFSLSPEKKKGVGESEHPNFSAFMINKWCWERVGAFNEIFKPCYFEDNDYHYRIKKEGMRAITLPMAMFYHYGSRTQNEATDKPICSSPQFEKNRALYISIWGDVPGNEKWEHPYGDESLSIKLNNDQQYEKI